MSGPVVVGVDEPVRDGVAVAWAEAEAAARRAELRLLDACGDAAPDYVRQALDALAETVRGRNPGLQVSVDARPGEARAVLGEAAAGAALLVLGARGTGGFPGLLVGSTSLHVAGTAPRPVVVVPERDAPVDPAREVVVGVDAKDPDEAVLDYAFETAQRDGRPLHALHAWRYPLITQGRATPPVYEEGHIADEQERRLAEVLAGWRERYPTVSVRAESAKSGAAKLLVAASAEASLVVVGRHGRPAGPLGRLGSVSLAIVQHAHCPVVVIPAD